MSTGSRRWVATGAAIFFVFLWGSAFVPSKIGVLESSPLWFLAVRFAVSAAIMLAIALALGSRIPLDRRTWALAALLGLLANAIYLGCQYLALRHLAAGVGAIISSTNPLVLALAAPYVLHERVTWRKAAGLVLGFGGVVAIMITRAGSGSAQPADALLSFVGIISSVTSTLLFKRFLLKIDLKMLTAMQLFAASLAVLPFALATEGVPHLPLTPSFLAAFFYLVLVMSIAGSLIWFWLLEHGEASRVSAYYFLSPVFGLLVAALFGEPLAVRDLGGLVAIALGIVIVQRS